MFAASVKSFYDVYKDHPEVLNKSNMSTLGISSLVSFIVALIAIRFFIGYLQKHGFKLFGYYRIFAGAIIFIMLIFSYHLKA
jgi:undecaprenyl-diphosphatase